MGVANGGFGPGDGLIDTTGGRLDVDGRSIVELRGAILGDMPNWIHPLCDFGCGTWAVVDARSGEVSMLDESGLAATGKDLKVWMAVWATSR